MTKFRADDQTQFEATVVANQRLTPEHDEEEVRELVLEVSQADFAFEVGQSIGVLAPPAPGEKTHARLYCVADLPARGDSGNPQITICVRRCAGTDPATGHEVKGVASNYLCDRAPGDRLVITGPFGIPFKVPAEPDANLILIGTGTGIAPFRAFVKHIYKTCPDWQGRIWLFYGSRTGLGFLYANEENDDLAKYYDRETFEAFKALSPKPNWADPIAWDLAFEERGDALWQMMDNPKTYVYVAGLEQMYEKLDAAFSVLAGSPAAWSARKAELVASQRWIELLY